MMAVLLALALVLLHLDVASAQTGLLIRANCTTDITNPVVFQTWCFDATTGQVKVWNGSAYVSAGSGVPGGADTQVQFNSTGNFAGSASFTFSNGILLTPRGTQTNPGLVVGPNTGYGFFFDAGNSRVGVAAAGVPEVDIGSGVVRVASTTQIQWSSSDPVSFGSDAIIRREAANTLSLRNGTNQQALRIYGGTNKYLNASHDGTNGVLGMIGGGNLKLSGVILSDILAGGGFASCLQVNSAGVIGNSGAACGTGGAGAGVTSLNALTGALLLNGTASQVTVNQAGSTFTLAAPQDINTDSNVEFSSVRVQGPVGPGSVIWSDGAGTPHLVTFKSSATNVNTTWTLPGLDSVGQQCFSSDGAGKITWQPCVLIAPGSSPAPGYVAFWGSSLTLTNDNTGNFKWDNTGKALTVSTAIVTNAFYVTASNTTGAPVSSFSSFSAASTSRSNVFIGSQPITADTTALLHVREFHLPTSGNVIAAKIENLNNLSGDIGLLVNSAYGAVGAWPLRVQTHGVDELVVTGDGRVGIGTATPDPTFRFHVYDGTTRFGTVGVNTSWPTVEMVGHSPGLEGPILHIASIGVGDGDANKLAIGLQMTVDVPGGGLALASDTSIGLEMSAHDYAPPSGHFIPMGAIWSTLRQHTVGLSDEAEVVFSAVYNSSMTPAMWIDKLGLHVYSNVGGKLLLLSGNANTQDRGLLMQAQRGDAPCPFGAFGPTACVITPAAAVASGDVLMRYTTQGYDGTNFITAIEERHEVDHAVSAGNVGAKWVLATRNASGSYADRATISSDGGVQIGSPSGGSQGLGSLNVASAIYINGSLIAGFGTTLGVTQTALMAGNPTGGLLKDSVNVSGAYYINGTQVGGLGGGAGSTGLVAGVPTGGVIASAVNVNDGYYINGDPIIANRVTGAAAFYQSAGRLTGSPNVLYAAAFGSTRAAIQSAINAAPSGGVVILDCINYTLDGTAISITKSLTLQGCGTLGTTITALGGTDNLISINSTTGAVRITNMQFSGGGTSIQFTGTSGNSSFDHLFFNSVAVGLLMYKDGSNTPNQWRFVENEVNYTDAGVRITASSDSCECMIRGNTIVSAGASTWGVDWQGSGDIRIVDNKFLNFTATGGGLHLGNTGIATSEFAIVGNVFSANAPFNILVDGSSNFGSGVIAGNEFNGASTSSIKFTGSHITDVTITGNHFHGTAGATGPVIHINTLDHFIIAGNAIVSDNGARAGVQLDANATNGFVGVNNYINTSPNVSGTGGSGMTVGFTGTKTAGACTFTLTEGAVTNVTGC